MKTDYTHITLLCDHSGSMATVRKEAELGVNQFIEDQKREPGYCTLHLAQFSAPVFTQYRDEFANEGAGYDTLFKGDIKDAPYYSLHPAGMTALLDALGKAIHDTGKFLEAMPEHERPEHVIFVVQTDGEENSSKRFKHHEISRMIKHQEETYQWTFVYLGMGPDTFAQGRDLGFSNAVQAADSGAAYMATYSSVSSNAAATRSGKTANWNVDVDSKGNVTERK